MSEKDASQTSGQDPFLDDFVEEAREHLATIGAGLLVMEGGGEDGDVVNSVFRALHTIKGVSAFLDLVSINRLSHAGENVLYAIRQNTLKPTNNVIDTLLSTCDLLAALVEDAAQGQNVAEHENLLKQLVDRLGVILEMAAAAGERGLSPGEELPVLWPAPGKDLAADLVNQFIAESTENLQEIEQALLQLEKHPANVDYINAVFRPMHTIKGCADYVGLPQIKTLGHHMETLLDLARAKRLSLSSELLSLVFEGIDSLRAMIGDLQPSGEVHRDLRILISQLLASAAQASSESQPTGLNNSALASQRSGSPLAIFLCSAAQHVESISLQSLNLLTGDSSPESLGVLRRSLTTLRVASNYVERTEFLDPCQQLLDLIDRLPEKFHMLEEQMQMSLGNIAKQIEQLLEDVRRDVEMEGELELEVERAESELTEGKSASGRGAGNARKQIGAKSIRVDQGKLDEYVNLAGELVVARNTLAHVFREFQLTTRNGASAKRLKSAIEGVDRIAGAIQENAMAMRMVPVKPIFERFPRVVRDIARSRGKTIELQMIGEDTEIDKQVAEALGDPLVHLVRNSADHGIETPEVRKAAGKAEAGLITLHAGREGNSVVIGIIDDGAGINVARLKAKAVENRLISQQTADEMAREDALQLIFAAGLSTAAKVTDISGRGVGMDVVRTNINNLGGSVHVTSEEGKGTQLRIQLPLTLAVTTGLLLTSAGQTFAIPIEIIQETVKVLPTSIKRLKGHLAITIRDRIIPVCSLAEILQSRTGLQAKRHQQIENLLLDDSGQFPIVVVELGASQFGLVVDDVVGQQEIVLKPLPKFLAQIPGLDSATVMGDGNIVLILDPRTMEDVLLGTLENSYNTSCKELLTAAHQH